MCGRYQFSADEYKEIRQIVRDAQRRSEGNELNFPMAGDIYPSQMAPVLVSRGEKIVGEFQQWGLPGFRGRQQIINARAETVTEKPMFRRSIAFQRCVIPATGFYEWDSAKHKYFFQMPGQPLYLAGIYDTINGVNCFIILTTAPNDSVAPMPDSDMQPRCFTRTTKVEVVPFEDVTADCAAAEGDGTLAAWKKAHRKAFAAACEEIGRNFDESMKCVCEYFDVVYRADGQ